MPGDGVGDRPCAKLPPRSVPSLGAVSQLRRVLGFTGFAV